MAIPIETIERLKTKLKAVPPKPRTEVESKKEAVLMLRAEVDKLKRDGYDWNDVAALIADDGQGGGIEVKGSSIKAFLSTPRTGGTRRKKATEDAGENWPKV